MANKFPQMSKSEILKLAGEVATSLKTIGAVELERMAKNEGSSSGSSSGSPEVSLGKGSASYSSSSSEGSLGKGSIPAEGSSASSEGSSAGGMPPGGEGSSPSASSSEGSSAGGMPPPGGEGMPPPGAEGSAPPGGMEGAPPPGAEGMPPPGQEGAPPAGPSFEELVSLYSALPPPDLEAHAAAMQQAMSMKQGGGMGGPPGAEGSAPPGGMPPPGGAPPMGKQEVKTHNPNIGLEPGGGTPGHVETANPNIGKSEGAVGDRLAKAEETVEVLVKVVDALSAPMRKAQTGITYIPYQGDLKKSEPGAPLKKSIGDMTRAEVHAALSRVCATPKLTKAERDVVNEFYLTPGNVQLADLESIINKA